MEKESALYMAYETTCNRVDREAVGMFIKIYGGGGRLLQEEKTFNRNNKARERIRGQKQKTKKQSSILKWD